MIIQSKNNNNNKIGEKKTEKRQSEEEKTMFSQPFVRNFFFLPYAGILPLSLPI